jgi:hypothetical protein
VCDLGSSNGTRVRDEALEAGTLAEVSLGETFDFGSCHALVQKKLRAAVRPYRVGTHGYFESRLDEECGRAKRTHAPVAILRIQVSGNPPRKELHERMTSCLRPGDLLATYGPNDYEVLLPDTPAEDTASSKVGRRTTASEQRRHGGKTLEFDPEMNAYKLGVGDTYVTKGENGWSVWSGDELRDPFKQHVPGFEVKDGPFQVAHDQGRYTLTGGHDQGRQTAVSFKPGEDGFSVGSSDANDATLFSKIKDRYSLARTTGTADQPTSRLSAAFDSESKDFSLWGSDKQGGVGLRKDGDSWRADWVTGSGDDKFSRSLTLNTEAKEGTLDVGGYQLYNREDTFGFTTGSEGFTIEEGFSGGTLTTRHHGDHPITVGFGDDRRFTLFGTTPGSIKGKPVDIEFMANKGMNVIAGENMGPVVKPTGDMPESQFWLGIKDPKTGISIRQGVRDGQPESWVGFDRTVKTW